MASQTKSGTTGSGIGSAPVVPANGAYDLIPQRSAPKPPTGGQTSTSTGASSAGGSGSDSVNRPIDPYTTRPAAQRSSYIAGSYRNYASAGPSNSASSPISPAGAGAKPSGPLSPMRSPQNPSGPSGSSSAFSAKPLPQRSLTADFDRHTGASASSSSPPLSAPLTGIQSMSLSPHAGGDDFPSSPLSGSSPGAYNPSGTQSQIVQPSSSRARGESNAGGRNTFKSVFGGFVNSMSDVFSQQTKKVEISTPYDPVHLTHVGFNSDTGEFTGLPREWQQLLQDSGISRQDQEANPQAVMDIVAFYQDATQQAGEDRKSVV